MNSLISKILRRPEKTPLPVTMARHIALAEEQGRQEARAELRQSVRDALFGVDSRLDKNAVDRLRHSIGLLFSDDDEQRAEWVRYVRDVRIAANELEFAEMQRKRGVSAYRTPRASRDEILGSCYGG